ncbi:MAG: hypothetical protein AAFW69_05940 [Pseudomonadota bacterium]
MGRSELIVLMTAVIVLAVLVGWLLRWGFAALNRAPEPGLEAEEAGGPDELETLAAAMAEAEASAATAEAVRETTERELRSLLRQAEIERDDAMDALGNARREALD